ncbi:hypothetical protein DRF57_01630 [Chryseobacterium rhizosphaerae]|uniref:Lanthionine synthetase n=1 Tax=Chryseobacterium rhizosphaerae TaxID=395937 RepID=A0ABX9IRG8_9FLAO|nr:hypothetical protein DRF57_01630 [Chryseobacterium rhizosphaerae]
MVSLIINNYIVLDKNNFTVNTILLNCAENKLKEISSVIIENEFYNKNIGVLGGISGIPIFLFYYSKYCNDPLYSERGQKYVEYIIDVVNSGTMLPTFCNGMSGAIWTIDFLKKNKFIDFNIDKNIKSFDEYFYEVMIQEINQGNYDFLHGALGYGYYFLERYNNTGNEKLKKKYLEYILIFIEKLELISVSKGEDTYWEYVNPLEYEKQINFGLAHGIPSILSFLTRVLESKINSLLAKQLSYKLLMIILKYSNNENVSVFPSKVRLENINDLNKDDDNMSRLAWCYGDLGVVNSLYRANMILKLEKIDKICFDIMIRTSLRRLYNESMVNDAGVCHGSFGISLLFKRFYELSGIEAMKDAYIFWLEDGLNRSNFQDGFAGFKAYNGGDYKNETNILNGITGIGLTLITFMSKKKTLWDRCLLIQ